MDSRWHGQPLKGQQPQKKKVKTVKSQKWSTTTRELEDWARPNAQLKVGCPGEGTRMTQESVTGGIYGWYVSRGGNQSITAQQARSPCTPWVLRWESPEEVSLSISHYTPVEKLC